MGPSPTLTTVNYDFVFRLCTSDTLNCSTGPVLVGTDTHLNVPVTDGIFTVKLNFSAANAFDGSPRWLLIGVKPAGDPGGYQALNPRQQVTSTPYAIKSKSADNSQQLGGVAANQYLQTNGNGSGLTNLNAGNITTGTLAIANGGTGSSTQNFVDLSTNQTNISGNKTLMGNLTVNGNVGVGTNNPAGKFHINVPGSGNPISALTLDVGTFGTGANSINSYFFKARDLGLGGTPAFLIRGDGNVGIGTATPTSKLFVSGTGGIRANVNSDSNAGLGLTLNNAPKWSVATVSPGQFQIFNDAIGQNAVWIDPANNNVGIGTPTPEQNLHVNGSGVLSTGPQSGFKFRPRGTTSNADDWVWFSAPPSGGAGGYAELSKAGNMMLRIFDYTLLVSSLAGQDISYLCSTVGGSVFRCQSSLRYKTNVATFNAGLDLVKRLRPVTFDWKEYKHPTSA